MRLPLLQERLWDEDVILRRDTSMKLISKRRTTGLWVEKTHDLDAMLLSEGWGARENFRVLENRVGLSVRLRYAFYALALKGRR